MAHDDLILAPENLQMLLQGLDGLAPVLGPEAGAELGRVRNSIETALAAQADGRDADAIGAITAAMRELVGLAARMDPAEAAMMRAVAGGFEAALSRGDAAGAAESVDTMRVHSGATKPDPEKSGF